MDLKFIGGQKALSMEQIHHIHTKNLSLYQWIAIDVHSRFRLMGYSYEKSWTNGLAWIFWVLSWLGSHGVQSQTFFTVDRGEAFGGKFWFKICKLRKLLSDFGYTFIQNRVGHPEDPPHIECSHQTDDEAFYIPQLLSIASKKKSFFWSDGLFYYYNILRRHSSLDRISPYAHLRKTTKGIDDKFRFIPPIFLDYLAVQLGDWSDHVLASHLNNFPLCFMMMIFHRQIVNNLIGKVHNSFIIFKYFSEYHILLLQAKIIQFIVIPLLLD